MAFYLFKFFVCSLPLGGPLGAQNICDIDWIPLCQDRSLPIVSLTLQAFRK